jgi:integrase
MARRINQLSTRSVATLKESGLYGDGNGLYLRVTPETTRSWMFRYMIAGKARTMGLGSTAVVSLAEAREAAIDLRRQIHRGVDPLEARRLEVERLRIENGNAQTFKDCAEAYITAHKVGWRNAKHAAQWTSTLETYVYPEIGGRPVQAIDTAAIMRILDPIWSLKPETANRVRGRTECVLDWATARKLRSGENPARWRGHLDKLLPARSKVRKVEHHSALPYTGMADFMARVRQQSGISALALEFSILTAARTGEVVGATWLEVDLDKKLWIVPAERMKAGKLHRVALSEAAISVLQQMEELKQGDFVFSGTRPNTHLSNMSLLQLLKRMNRSDITVQGFRSTFSDWAAEQTEYPRDLVEMALAHTIGNRAEAAYRRGDMLERRQKLMDDWAAYCQREPRDMRA